MPAVGRGHWDRARTRGERLAAGRSAIVGAARTARSVHGSAVTVAHVAALAGVGRNTFYDHFPDLPAALAAAEEDAADALARALEKAAEDARTPIEKLRAVARAWVDAASADGALGHGISAWRGREVSHLERTLRDVLSEAKAAGVIGRAPDALRVRCLAGAFLGACCDPSGRSPGDPENVAEILVDLAIRALR